MLRKSFVFFIPILLLILLHFSLEKEVFTCESQSFFEIEDSNDFCLIDQKQKLNKSSQVKLNFSKNPKYC